MQRQEEQQHMDIAGKTKSLERKRRKFESAASKILGLISSTQKNEHSTLVLIFPRLNHVWMCVSFEMVDKKFSYKIFTLE